MTIQEEFISLNQKINIPSLFIYLGAENVRRLKNKADYRCNAFWRCGDNPSSCGITFNKERKKYLVTDFVHHSCINQDLLDFLTKCCHYKFNDALNLLRKYSSDEYKVKSSEMCNIKTNDYEVKVLPNTILDLFDYGLHPYLQSRGYTPEVAYEFGLGYSSCELMDGRVIIPIVNEEGQLVSIQGRTFTNDELRYKFLDGTGTQAKNTLYNLFNARKYIEQKGFVMLYEGAPSCWRSFQYGLKNCVATLSTTVTDKQLELLLSLDVKIVIAFDYDSETQAGQINTIKLAQRIKSLGFNKGCYTLNIGELGLSGAIDDLTLEETKLALKNIKKLF